METGPFTERFCYLGQFGRKAVAVEAENPRLPRVRVVQGAVDEAQFLTESRVWAAGKAVQAELDNEWIGPLRVSRLGRLDKFPLKLRQMIQRMDVSLVGKRSPGLDGVSPSPALLIFCCLLLPPWQDVCGGQRTALVFWPPVRSCRGSRITNPTYIIALRPLRRVRPNGNGMMALVIVFTDAPPSGAFWPISALAGGGCIANHARKRPSGGATVIFCLQPSTFNLQPSAVMPCLCPSSLAGRSAVPCA